MRIVGFFQNIQKSHPHQYSLHHTDKNLKYKNNSIRLRLSKLSLGNLITSVSDEGIITQITMQ